ncbi:coiled-coil domain-containing protein 86-like [Ctenocephalides felis]|uniref:coiled-coil domain-containing protein 86-like n=1 Tax=Ctenocephalides felis TaxID=7515 RepID=UPI000E6E1423|nr:coiled-coil domain-containing protein 86-like [Ctenocephalides felis]
MATTTVVKGKPKSGRSWKSDRDRFSSVKKTKGIRKSFEKKQILRQELKRTKEASRAVLQKRQEEKEEKRKRREENLKRQEENRKKAEIVQVIKNVAKIKKMKKKQLRSVEKRDTLNM